MLLPIYSQQPVIIVTHSKYVLERALAVGWQAGARYTNLRDVRHLDRFYFLDIDWKNYNFERHLATARRAAPLLTVARDVLDVDELPQILREADALRAIVPEVIVVPKDPRLMSKARLGVPVSFRLGYSVPTRYGATAIPVERFEGEVHLLGGRPDIQRSLADRLDVRSLDGNRFTYDAKFGDFFDGTKFRRHPTGGYDACIRDSISAIHNLWK